jgi:hypothetical protein
LGKSVAAAIDEARRIGANITKLPGLEINANQAADFFVAKGNSGSPFKLLHLAD